MDALVRSMHIFIVTAESSSMTMAAKQLHISSSAVSQHIQKLEQQLNINLLHRNTRQLTLTEAGELYYQNCKETLRLWQQTEQKINVLSQSTHGELRISAPVGFAACGLLSKPLQELLHTNEQLSLHLFMQDDEFDLIANRIDLALCVQTGPLPDSSLVARPLAEWDMVLVASPDYLAQKGHVSARSVTEPKHLASLDWLQHINSRGYELQLKNSDEQTTISANVKLRINNMQALIQFTRDGLGFAILPKPEIMSELQQGKLCQLLPDWQLPKIQIYAITSTRDSQPAKVRTAISILSKAMQAYHN